LRLQGCEKGCDLCRNTPILLSFNAVIAAICRPTLSQRNDSRGESVYSK
jgi:hypothetical protein